MRISDKIDFKTDCLRGKGHYIKIQNSIQKDITIVNTYAPNIGTPNLKKQIINKQWRNKQ